MAPDKGLTLPAISINTPEIHVEPNCKLGLAHPFTTVHLSPLGSFRAASSRRGAQDGTADRCSLFPQDLRLRSSGRQGRPKPPVTGARHLPLGSLLPQSRGAGVYPCGAAGPGRLSGSKRSEWDRNARGDSWGRRVSWSAAFHLGATQGSPESQLVCLGEFGEHAMTDGTERIPGWRRWAGGGGGGGGATYIFRVSAPGAIASTPSWVSQAPLSLWAPGGSGPGRGP